MGGWLLAGGTGAAAADGKAIFLKNCAPCHSADGRARTPAARKLGVKDLSASRLVDADIRKQIAQGVLDPAGKAKMPSFEGKFSEDELRALLKVVKGFRK